MADTAVVTKTKTNVKPPSFWKVIFWDDDYTPMDFVVAVLMQIFKMSEQEATDIMLYVHKSGRGVAGIFTYEIATQKREEAMSAARNRKHPLKVTLEETIG